MSDRHTMAKDRQGKSIYLGDGVYATHDGFGVWLTAEDGIQASDAIYIEPSILNTLVEFFKAQARA